MKLSHVRHVVALAERGSPADAAEELGVSRHALIRSVRALERELGTPLFRRGRQAVTLTPVGELFIRRASAAQRDLDRASEEITRDAGSPTGRVSIGLSAGAHVSLLPMVLQPFQTVFDDVRVRIIESAFEVAERHLRDGVLDFYVGPLPSLQRAGGLPVERLRHGRLIVVARAGHPLASVTSLAALAGETWTAPVPVPSWPR